MMQKATIPEVSRTPPPQPGFISGFWLVHLPERKPLPETSSFMAARVIGIDSYLKVTSNQHDFKYADFCQNAWIQIHMVPTSQDCFQDSVR